MRAVNLEEEPIHENRMNELTLQEAALAWAQGKRVEAAVIGGDEWLPIDPIGECLRNTYPPTVFSCGNEYSFRLAPEPPAKRYRPWTPEEVPVGAVIRNKGGTGISIIVNNGSTIEAGFSCVSYLNTLTLVSRDEALERREYSIDPIGTPANKRTWLPCGVEVDA
jgi:hypothetical protein